MATDTTELRVESLMNELEELCASDQLSLETLREIIDQMPPFSQSFVHALANGGGGEAVLPQELIDAANKLNWPISDKKEAAQAMMEICTSGSVRVNLPRDERKARIAVGKIVIMGKIPMPRPPRCSSSFSTSLVLQSTP